MVDAVGDKEGRKDIDGVMDVAQEHDDRKGDAVGVGQKHNDAYKHNRKRAVDKKTVNLEDGDIGEDNVGDRGACLVGGLLYRPKVDEQRADKRGQGGRRGKAEVPVEPRLAVARDNQVEHGTGIILKVWSLPPLSHCSSSTATSYSFRSRVLRGRCSALSPGASYRSGTSTQCRCLRHWCSPMSSPTSRTTFSAGW